MSRSVGVAAFIFGVMLGMPALADAGGDCSSGASAPALPGASNEDVPRSCDGGPNQQAEPTAQPPMPPAEPPDAIDIPQPSAPAETSDPFADPVPQQ